MTELTLILEGYHQTPIQTSQRNFQIFCRHQNFDMAFMVPHYKGGWDKIHFSSLLALWVYCKVVQS